MKRSVQWITCLLTLCAGPLVLAQVANTRHNLSVSGPGPVAATSESEICIFCHTAHNASPVAPLWNRPNPGSVYTPYSSSTAKAFPGQPTGTSILCLSCHDGTIALGQVLSRTTPIAMTGGVSTLPAGPGRLGTDLSDDHPISFAYTSALASQRGELADPGALTGSVRLDSSGQMQCTSCHDAHKDTAGKFLVKSNQASALCQTCHQKNDWMFSTHKTSTATWNAIPPDPWPSTNSSGTVADHACDSCHTPHTAGGKERLLHYQAEENNCISCHNNNVASTDIAAEFNKTSSHPLQATQGVHSPGENAIVGTRHVECADCHDPHATTAAPTGNVPGALKNVRGINIVGSEVKPITAEYQLCFRCHADSTGKPPALTPRQLSQTNVRLEFNTANPSFHPVAGVGRNPNVPSLIAPLTESSIITCGDCHNNNSAAGPAGPHGSIYSPLLVRRYQTQDGINESASNYALCYGCHDRNNILNDNSFKEHDKHIRGENAPCNVCHDPHGVSLAQGNATNNSKLINFDTSVVSPDNNGRLRFESTGTFKGRCYLNCHGKQHNPESY